MLVLLLCGSAREMPSAHEDVYTCMLKCRPSLEDAPRSHHPLRTDRMYTHSIVSRAIYPPTCGKIGVASLGVFVPRCPVPSVSERERRAKVDNDAQHERPVLWLRACVC